MLVFLIFINLISNTIEFKLGILIDQLFNEKEIAKITMKYCKNINKDSLYYRGRHTNIKDIIDSYHNNNLNKYEVVYIPELKYFQNVTLFPKSTIFLYHGKIKYNQSYYNKDYCFIEIQYDFEPYDSFFFVIGKTLSAVTEELLIITFIAFNFTLVILIMISSTIIYFKKFDTVNYVYRIALFNIIFILMVSFSSIYIKKYDLFHFLYCFYKTFFYIFLYFLVNGFKILDDNYPKCLLFKSFILFLLYNSISTFFFIYIVYFIPSINNFYFFSLKNVIEHIVLLIRIIKSIKEKLIPFVRQYKIERRLRRNIVAKIYKIQLYVYYRMIVFGCIYSISFILLPFIEIILSLDNYIEIFYYNYYFNISLEIFLGLLFGTIFFSLKNSRLYCYRLFKNGFLYSKIDENNNNISNLSKAHLNTKLPIVLLNPFLNENIIIQNLHLGIINNKK